MVPIEDHGIIGDLQTAALVSIDGDIDWLCLPRFDSPSVFASILDDERGGRFTVRCAGASKVKQMYLPDSNVLLTRFLGEHSVGEVVDFMVPSEPGHREQGAHQLVRMVRAVRGRVEVEIRCEPAFDYGRARTEVDVVEGSGAFFSSAQGQLVLRSTVPLTQDGCAAVARPVLEEGESLALSLSRKGSLHPLDMLEVDHLLDVTLAYWQRWIRRSRYHGRYREMVERSALTLKLLVYQPTGALVAAPTTSLPEAIGGERNWDYRYTWVRDAAFSIYALMRLGFTDEAAGFMDWLEARCKQAPPGTGLQILYSIDGDPATPETTLDHLKGYQDSRPVRIGNGAANQRQLDIYGELMDSVYLYNKHGRTISYDLWVALCRQLDWLQDHWEEADHGVWEVRGPTRRFTYSTVMTWVAFERAGRIARQRGLPAPLETWRAHADRAFLQVQEHGWSPERRGLHAVPRQPHPGRRRPGHAAGEVFRPAPTRASSPPSTASRRNSSPTAWCTATTPTAATASWTRRAPSTSAPSGTSRRSPEPAGWTRRGTRSRRCSRTPTTWACTPRRSAPPARRSATSRRPSPTWR